MTTFSGSFSTTDKDKTIRPNQEEKIAQQIIDTFAPEMMTGQVSSDTLNRLQDSYVAKGGSGLNPYMRERNKQQQIGAMPLTRLHELNLLNKQKLAEARSNASVDEVIDIFEDEFTAQAMRPPAQRTNITVQNQLRDNIYDIASNKSAKELADRYNKSLWPSGTPVKEMIINRATRSGVSPEVVAMASGMLGGYDPGSAGDELGSATPIYNPYQQLLDSFTGQEDLGGTTGSDAPVDELTDLAMRKFKAIEQPPPPPEGTANVGQGFDPNNTGISPIVKQLAGWLGYDMDSREGLAEYFYDTAMSDKNYREGQESRNLDQDREMARLAALAQQTQPVDPCPEGYRLDPVSRSCVPTDDTTDTAPGTGGIYEPLIKPVENYTQASPYTVPAINLPDIFTGN